MYSNIYLPQYLFLIIYKEEETKKKKVTLKKSTHVTPNRFKVKKEEHIDVNENEIEMPDNDSNEIEEFSHDSCYGKFLFILIKINTNLYLYYKSIFYLIYKKC